MTEQEIFDELSKTMQKGKTLKNENIQIQKDIPIDKDNTQLVVTDIDLHSRDCMPPKLPFLKEINELKRSKLEKKHIQAIYEETVHSKDEQNNNALPTVHDIENIFEKDSMEVEKQDYDIDTIDMAIKMKTPSKEETVYVRDKILGDIARYNENRRIQPTVTNTVKSHENNSKNMVNNKPVASIPPKLPFLNDICLLKIQDGEFTAEEPSQLKYTKEDTREHLITKHIGHIENRPHFGVLPFLDDIKSIGIMKAKTIGSKSANSIQMPKMVSSSVTTQQESKYSGKQIQKESMEEDSSLCQSEANKEQHHEVHIHNYSGIQNLQNILIQNKKEKNLIPKTVRFSFEDEEILSYEKKDSIENTIDYSKTSDSKSNNIRVKKTSNYNIKIDEKTNMTKLADQIIPQLNTMQKNYLGLLFFNELSENIVEDVVAQQLSEMTGTDLGSMLNNLEQQVYDSLASTIMSCVSEEVRTLLVCDAFGNFKTAEKAAVVFSTGSEATDVCTTVADFGGRTFKKAFIKKMMANEDNNFRDEVVQDCRNDQCYINYVANYVVKSGSLESLKEPKYQHSEDDETYSSAEESLEEEVSYN